MFLEPHNDYMYFMFWSFLAKQIKGVGVSLCSIITTTSTSEHTHNFLRKNHTLTCPFKWHTRKLAHSTVSYVYCEGWIPITCQDFNQDRKSYLDVCPFLNTWWLLGLQQYKKFPKAFWGNSLTAGVAWQRQRGKVEFKQIGLGNNAPREGKRTLQVFLWLAGATSPPWQTGILCKVNKLNYSF